MSAYQYMNQIAAIIGEPWQPKVIAKPKKIKVLNERYV